MDKPLRSASDPEWVLMYRLGLGRSRIAALVRAAPATVGTTWAERVTRLRPPGLVRERIWTPLRLARQDQLIGKELAKESL